MYVCLCVCVSVSVDVSVWGCGGVGGVCGGVCGYCAHARSSPAATGDPTVFGNMGVPESVVSSITEQLRSGKYNGYPHSVGYPQARAAVGAHYSAGAASYSTEVCRRG